jgi:hypothetical protein
MRLQGRLNGFKSKKQGSMHFFEKLRFATPTERVLQKQLSTLWKND